MPSSRIAAARPVCSASTGAIRSGRRMAGSAVRASTAPPAGSEAAPARAITPLGPTMIPGVASPWISSSAVMVENAAPSRTVRPSLARAPAIVSQTEATAATSAPVATSAKWTQEAKWTSRPPTACSTAGTPTAHAQMSASNPRGACPFLTIEGLSADQRTMCSPIIEGIAASPFVTGSTALPASSAASLRAIAARITVAPATRSGSGGTIFGGGSTHAQRAAVLGAPERQRRERAARQVRGPDAVAGVAERRPRAAALERDDGRQVGGGDVDRPAPGVLDPAALEHREDPQQRAARLLDDARRRAPRARACARPTSIRPPPQPSRMRPSLVVRK